MATITTMKVFEEVKTLSVPCEEYPGKWILSFSRDEITPDSKLFFTLIEANQYAKIQAEKRIKGSIWWEASDDDPRRKEDWFQGCYKAYLF